MSAMTAAISALRSRLPWPATNTRQHFANVAKNQFLEITEFATEYRRVMRKTVTLGGAARGKP